MLKTTTAPLLTFAVALCLPHPALAHITPDMGKGFMAGIKHPVFGLDHLLAMLSVGIVSTQLRHRYAIWTLPATFVGVMTVGGLVGMAGVKIEGTEIGIALSVMILGTSIYFGSHIREWIVYAFVAFFALCHGYAHGSEMPEEAQAGMFALGFMITTAVIHLCGVSIGLFATEITTGQKYLRFAGGVFAGIGVSFLLAALNVSAT